MTWLAPPTVRRPMPSAPKLISLAADEPLGKLDDRYDYVIQLPNVPRTVGLRLLGGRTRLVVGGYCSTAQGRTEPNITVLAGAAGAVTHLEGLLIDGAGGGRSDAFHLHCPKNRVQILRCHVATLNGALSDTHADVIQNLGTAGLAVERFTGRSHYNNGYQRRENNPIGDPLGPSTWNRVNMGGYKTNPVARQGDPVHTLRSWSLGTQPLDPGDPTVPINGMLTGSVWFYECYGNAAEAGLGLGDFMWPHAGQRMEASCRAQLAANGQSADWPRWRTPTAPPAGETLPSAPGQIGSGDAKVYGVIKLGPPTNGDWCKRDTVGLAYPRVGA